MTTPYPIPAVTEAPYSPWCEPLPPSPVDPPPWLADAVFDAQRRSGELERNEASEFSFGKGRVVPWVARQARQERRYPQTTDGYSTPYHGKTPPCAPSNRMAGHPDLQRPRTHGTQQLHRFLNRNG